jgi:hypothetical protein
MAAAAVSETHTFINSNLINVKPGDFKYTNSAQRKEFVRRAYPFFDDLVRIPTRIPWTTYEYEGSTTFLVEAESGKKSDDFQSEFAIKAAYPDLIPYYFFGGCCYEILHKLIKKEELFGADASARIPSIRELLDPTGDIDIQLFRPRISTVLPDEVLDFDIKTKESTQPNEFIDHWSHWIFTHVTRIFMETELANRLSALCDDFDYTEDDEARSAIEQVKLGKIYILRTVYNENLKIQCLVKFTGVEKSDHILEFVYPLRTKEDRDNVKFRQEYFEIQSMRINNIRIQSFAELLRENVDSISNRSVFIGNLELQHKFYNHVQRLIYLNHIIPLFIAERAAANRPYLIYSGSNYEYNLTSKLEQVISLFLHVANNQVLNVYDPNFRKYATRLAAALTKDPELFCKFDYEYAGSCTPEIKRALFRRMFSNLIGPGLFLDADSHETIKAGIDYMGGGGGGGGGGGSGSGGVSSTRKGGRRLRRPSRRSRRARKTRRRSMR